MLSRVLLIITLRASWSLSITERVIGFVLIRLWIYVLYLVLSLSSPRGFLKGPISQMWIRRHFNSEMIEDSKDRTNFLRYSICGVNYYHTRYPTVQAPPTLSTTNQYTVIEDKSHQQWRPPMKEDSREIKRAALSGPLSKMPVLPAQYSYYFSRLCSSWMLTNLSRFGWVEKEASVQYSWSERHGGLHWCIFSFCCMNN